MENLRNLTEGEGTDDNEGDMVALCDDRPVRQVQPKQATVVFAEGDMVALCDDGPVRQVQPKQATVVLADNISRNLHFARRVKRALHKHCQADDAADAAPTVDVTMGPLSKSLDADEIDKCVWGKVARNTTTSMEGDDIIWTRKLTLWRYLEHMQVSMGQLLGAIFL